MASLKPNPTIKEFQEYIEIINKERGFDKESGKDKFILFMEEVGELARAIRKHENLPTSSDTKKAHGISEELADLFICLLNFANIYDIDIEKAFREKEEKNNQRAWK